MKALAFPFLLLAFGAAAQDLLTPAPDGKGGGGAMDARPRVSLDPSDPAIQKVVRDIVAEDKRGRIKANGQVLRGDPSHDAFSRRMDEATVPDCLHANALKHEPPKLGPVGLGGLFALPFWAAAALTGKCR